MSAFGINNALAWVHFQVRGGWKRSVMITVGGMIVIGVMMMLSVVQSTGAGGYSRLMSWWAQILLGFEGLILILYGSATVGGAIRSDITEGMIESHRLMPMSAVRAVGGYLVGGGLAALVPAGGIIVLDLFAALAGQVPMDRWVLSQVGMAGLAGTLWLISAAGSFMGRLSGNLLVVFIVIGAFASQALFAFFPGLLILILPSIAQISLIKWGSAEDLFFVALGFQVLLAGLFLVAAVRRYARDDVSCFGVLPGLGLVALWSAMSAIGTTQYETLRIDRDFPGGTAMHCIGSLSILMVLALIPLSNAAREARAVSSSSSWRKRMAPMMVVGVAVILAIPLTLPMVNETTQFWMKAAQTLVVVAAWLLGMRFLLRWVYQVVPKGFVIGFIWMLLVWFGPMVADAIMQAVLYPDQDVAAGWLSAASPLGALLQIWGQKTTAVVAPGLGIQIGLIFVTLLFNRRRAPRLMKPVAAVGVPVASHTRSKDEE